MGHRMPAVGIGHGGAHHSQPKTAVALEHQNRLGTTLAMGLEQRHAELLSHVVSPWFVAQAAQQWIDLRKRNETGALGIGDQDQTIQPLHFLKQVLDRGQQRRKGKSQSRFDSLSFLLI